MVTVFGGGDMPVFLLTVFGKDEKANLTNAERNSTAEVAQAISDEYRAKVRKAKR